MKEKSTDDPFLKWIEDYIKIVDRELIYTMSTYLAAQYETLVEVKEKYLELK